MLSDVRKQVRHTIWTSLKTEPSGKSIEQANEDSNKDYPCAENEGNP
jgi:hypothetical protein